MCFCLVKFQVGETLLKILVDEPAFPSAIIGNAENAKLPDSDQILVDESAIASATCSHSDKALGSDPDKGKRAGVLSISTPAVRSLAKLHGIDINEVCGTGKDGRVLKEDVLNFAVKKGIIKIASVDVEPDRKSVV